MQHEILYRPSYSLVVAKLGTGETLTAETGAMVSMSDGVRVETNMRGGLMGGLKRMVLGGESLFLNTFTADRPGEVTLGPALPGDIMHLPMNGQTMFLQSGAFLGSSAGVVVDTKWAGGRGFFSGEGLFLLKVTGQGDLFFSSYGAIHAVDLAAGQKYTVDTSHMVAFPEGMGYEVRRIGGWKTTLLGGEGLVVQLTGPGRAYLQTRSQQDFLSWLVPLLPTQRQ